MEEDLNFAGNWKMTSICKANGRRSQFLSKMEDNLNFFLNWNKTTIFRQMEDDFNLLGKPHFLTQMGEELNSLGKWKMTSTF